MTKTQWQEHIMETNANPANFRPEVGSEDWRALVRIHHEQCPDCPQCKARRKTRLATAHAKAIREAYKACGMVKTPYGWE